MTIKTVLLFLLGDGSAIRAICGTTDALAVGALLVLSAGMARAWHRKNLRSEPWHLLLPFAASIGSTFVFVLGLCVWHGQSLAAFVEVFPPILRAFWMTAPLAWLYGLPFDAVCSRLQATKARMWTLLIVAMWRVLLMVRVVSVVCSVSGGLSFLYVSSYSVIVAVVAMWSTLPNKPDTVPQVVSLMGGVSGSPLPDELNLVRNVATVSGVLFFGGACILLPILFWSWSPLPLHMLVTSRDVQPSLWNFTLGVCIFFAALVIWYQRRFRSENEISEAIRQEQFANAIKRLNQLTPNRLPWNWQPPFEDIYRGGSAAPLFQLLTANDQTPGPVWVHATLTTSLGDFVRRPILWWFDDQLVCRVFDHLKHREVSSEVATEALKEIKQMEAQIRRVNWFEQQQRQRQSSHEEPLPPVFSEHLISKVPEITDERRGILDQLKDRTKEADEPFLKETDDEA